MIDAKKCLYWRDSFLWLDGEVEDLPRKELGGLSAGMEEWNGSRSRIRLKKRTVEKIGLALVIVAIIGMVQTLSGCSTTTDQAYTAHTADVGSTVAGLSLIEGAAEANPVALPMLPVRYMVTHAFRDAPCSERTLIHAAQSGVGFGAAANNLLLFVAPAIAPVGLLAAIPAYHLTKNTDCELTPLTDEQILLLAKWRKAYTERDSEAVAEVLDNPELAGKYAEFFRKMENIEATYYNPSRSEDGFVVDYEVTWYRRNGEVETRKGGLEFKVKGGVLTDIG